MASLLDPEPAKRPNASTVVASLNNTPPIVSFPVNDPEAKLPELTDTVSKIASYIESQSTCHRVDRLFPSDPELFSTNPLGIAHGACGIALALKQMTGKVPQEVVAWILQHLSKADQCPPGLYVGQSGIAWALDEMGHGEVAAGICRTSQAHPLLMQSPDIYHGAAGWGMTQLRFFLRTGDEEYLSCAKQAAHYLLSTARDDGKQGQWWESLGERHFGLAHGASGISLFLLYLYLTTNEQAYLETGLKGIEADLTKGIATPDGGTTWRVRESSRTVVPYWRYGSVGVGAALARYNLVLNGQPRFEEALGRITIDADRRYTIFPGKFFGLAGLGDFFLDLVRFGIDPNTNLRRARKVADGALLYSISRPEGIAFPGEELMRISCDYATGGAGIGMFLQRLDNPNIAAPFLLDDLFAVFGKTEFKQRHPDRVN